MLRSLVGSEMCIRDRIDGAMLLYRGRPVVPSSMREQVLQTLHSAHQGVTRMVARAEESLFWPGMTNDIKMMRESCHSCRKYAPSQSKLPPWDPVIPEYPFQLALNEKIVCQCRIFENSFLLEFSYLF